MMTDPETPMTVVGQVTAYGEMELGRAEDKQDQSEDEE